MVVVLVVALMVAGSSIQFLCWEGDVLTQELRSLVGARSVGWRPPLSAVYPLPTHPHHTICHHTVTLHFGLGKIKNQTSLAIMLYESYNIKILKPKCWNFSCESYVFFQPPSLKTAPVAFSKVGKT